MSIPTQFSPSPDRKPVLEVFTRSNAVAEKRRTAATAIKPILVMF